MRQAQEMDEAIATRPAVRNLVVHAKLPEEFRPALEQSERERLEGSPPARLVRIDDPVAKRTARKRKGATVPPPGTTGTYRAGLNFYVIKDETGVSFIVFPKSGDVIATGVPNEDCIRPALRVLAARIKPFVTVQKTLAESVAGLLTYVAAWQKKAQPEGGDDDLAWRVKTVNGTFTGRVRVTCDSVCELVSRYPTRKGPARPVEASVNFRSHTFPAARIRIRESERRSTVNLFNNGSYVLVGTKSQEEADQAWKDLCAIIRSCLTISGRAIPCAPAAASSSTGCTG